jgi:hypothetical protein
LKVAELKSAAILARGYTLCENREKYPIKISVRITMGKLTEKHKTIKEKFFVIVFPEDLEKKSFMRLILKRRRLIVVEINIIILQSSRKSELKFCWRK